MELIIVLVVACLIFALLWYAIGLLPSPPIVPPVKTVLYILLILAAVAWLAQRFGVF